jgi:threonine dehydrogenase-like Zn-dependent dehydrogenase
MKALCWHGKGDIRCDDAPDPQIEYGRDAIIRMTACAICGSDLHLLDGYIPFMEKGDVLGHEFMGEVVEVGAENKKLKVGDRVVVPLRSAAGNASSVARAIGRSANARTARRLWWLPGQGPFRCGHEQGAHDPNGTDTRQPVRLGPASPNRRRTD